MLNIEIPCRYCFTPNKVHIGNNFPNLMTVYRCYVCDKISMIDLRQKPVSEDQILSPQLGRPVRDDK